MEIMSELSEGPLTARTYPLLVQSVRRAVFVDGGVCQVGIHVFQCTKVKLLGTEPHQTLLKYM